MPEVNATAKEFENLRNTLERLATAVLDQMKALEVAVNYRDGEALVAIVGRDQDIDALELTLDRLARTFMELRAPLGPDFRYVMSALDIARNLERIGDCIEYVARHVGEAPSMPDAFPAAWDVLLAMLEQCREILATAHASWQKGDARLARRVPTQDDVVDGLQKQAHALVVTEVRSGKVDVELGMQAMLIANKLESIADIASHIAESVVFVIHARQIRHEKRLEG